MGTEVVVLMGRRFLLLTVKKYETYQPEILFDEEKGIWSGTKRARERARLGHEKGTTLNEEVELLEDVKKREYISPVAFQNHWNSHPSLKRCRSMTKDRKRKLAIRAEGADFRENWSAAIDALTTIPFYRGENDRGWRADVDWFLRNDSNWVKGLEQVDTVEARKQYSKERVRKQEQAILERAEKEDGKDDLTPEAQAFVSDLIDRTGVNDG